MGVDFVRVDLVGLTLLFNLNAVNEDGNWQVCMYCMHARKGASEAPRTHFRACKIAKFPHTISMGNPLGGPGHSSIYLVIFWD